MASPAVKIGPGPYAEEYCMIDEPEPDGGGVEFWVIPKYEDIEPRGWLPRLIRRVADWIGGL